jgi:rhodanese-related sulfurtransferase
MSDTRSLGEIDAPTLKTWLERGDVALIDIREAHENAAERIAGGYLAPLSDFAARAPANQAGTAVFYCRSGNRTGKNAALWATTGYERIYHLVGGIEGWKAAGYPVDRG